MSHTDKLREIAVKWCPWSEKTSFKRNGKDYVPFDQMVSDLTALISENYYPKEFVKWTFRQRFMSCGHLDFDSSILDLDLEYWHKHIKGKENEQ